MFNVLPRLEGVQQTNEQMRNAHENVQSIMEQIMTPIIKNKMLGKSNEH